MKSHKNMKSWKIGSKNFEKKSAKGFLISYYSMLISISIYCLPHCFYNSHCYMALMSLAGDPSKFLPTFLGDPLL